MGADPTHQDETEVINTNIWTAEEGGEDALLVPFRIKGPVEAADDEAMLTVEGQAILTSHCETKHAHRSLGSTAPASTPAMRGPWSCTTSVREDDLYPAEHLFVRMLKDTDDPNETPYTATTTGYPLYKGSYGILSSLSGQVPLGFVHN